ncbi:hypothetical protein [Aestuariivirga sp.]|uniref:hypothetical protein n=1 Tax=Aestuariivirga sp. TaxID=2650926 RepID=UPI0039E63014
MNAIQTLVCEPVSLGMVWVLAFPLFVLALFALIISAFQDDGDCMTGYAIVSMLFALMGLGVVLFGLPS